MIKKILPFCCVLLCACSFRSKQQEAEHLVKLYLDSTLNDPQSYQNVKFNKLDTLKTDAMDQPAYKALDKEFDSLQIVSDVLSTKIRAATSVFELNYFTKLGTENIKQKSRILNVQKKFLDKFKGQFIGWKIRHSYRAKNSFGALTLGATEFYLNKELTRVDSSYNLEKSK